MKHGSDPPSEQMGHKIPNNKNDVKLLRGIIWLQGTTFHQKWLWEASKYGKEAIYLANLAPTSSFKQGDNLTPIQINPFL
jgi:hypothetical protein